MRAAIVLLGLLAAGEVAAQDARSVPPGWSWGASQMSAPFDVDENRCTKIPVPVGGSKVGSGAVGESCPANSVAHGYWFAKKKETVYGSPVYMTTSCWRITKPNRKPGGTCPLVFNGIETNPTTGATVQTYKDIEETWRTCEPDIGGYLCEVQYRFKKFVRWKSKATYTIDPNKIFMNCCQAKR